MLEVPVTSCQRPPVGFWCIFTTIVTRISLVFSGADPKIVDGYGNTGIHLACSIGHPEMLNAILTVVLSCNGLYNYEGEYFVISQILNKGLRAPLFTYHRNYGHYFMVP